MILSIFRPFYQIVCINLASSIWRCTLIIIYLLFKKNGKKQNIFVSNFTHNIHLLKIIIFNIFDKYFNQ